MAGPKDKKGKAAGAAPEILADTPEYFKKLLARYKEKAKEAVAKEADAALLRTEGSRGSEEYVLARLCRALMHYEDSITKDANAKQTASQKALDALKPVTDDYPPKSKRSMVAHAVRMQLLIGMGGVGVGFSEAANHYKTHLEKAAFTDLDAWMDPKDELLMDHEQECYQQVKKNFLGKKVLTVDDDGGSKGARLQALLKKAGGIAEVAEKKCKISQAPFEAAPPLKVGGPACARGGGGAQHANGAVGWQ